MHRHPGGNVLAGIGVLYEPLFSHGVPRHRLANRLAGRSVYLGNAPSLAGPLHRFGQPLEFFHQRIDGIERRQFRHDLDELYRINEVCIYRLLHCIYAVDHGEFGLGYVDQPLEYLLVIEFGEVLGVLGKHVALGQVVRHVQVQILVDPGRGVPGAHLCGYSKPGRGPGGPVILTQIIAEDLPELPYRADVTDLGDRIVVQAPDAFVDLREVRHGRLEVPQHNG